ncbi:hypothetical protein MKY98_17815 [Paenibacillus sp. FSL M8-0228]|uniref:hypothetical protein n=1 Tax=Paenibacillus TaxID=44249 RepID=UPI00083E3FF1|nr:hypothetical protein [Paenibacillus polymyxa]MBO3286216.1 hypothetical protein [Paenibacillus polymyxa]ODB57800.1 hypothetical protein A7311_14375 [Paenibacillus polymyxa]
MIIEVDGYYIHCLLVSDRDIDHQEIVEIYEKAKETCSKTKDIPMKLKEYLNLKEVQKIESLRIDYVIDTDTDRIYKPIY